MAATEGSSPPAQRTGPASLRVVALASYFLVAAAQHCPAVPSGSAPPKQILTGEIIHSSKIITAGQCCPNYVPLPEPPTPHSGRLAKMAPCSAKNSLQAWGFAASGRFPPPGSLTLRGVGQSASTCITNPAPTTGAPVTLQVCHDGASAEPTQSWSINASAIVGGGQHGCLSIRENLKPQKGEETGDIHAIIPCSRAPNDPDTRWRYDLASGHIVSECTDPTAHCHQWNGQCLTGEPAPRGGTHIDSTAAAVGQTPDDGSCSTHYYNYGDPACVLSSNDTLICIFCANRNPKTADNSQWDDTVYRRSFDRGETWQPLQTMYHWHGNNASGPKAAWKSTCGSAPVLDRTTGTLWNAISFNASGILMTHSTDHGSSWAPAVDITAAAKPAGWGWTAFTVSGTCRYCLLCVYMPAIDRSRTMIAGTQLRTGPHKGRLMMTISLMQNEQYTAYPIAPSQSGLLISDDHGASWHAGGTTQVNMTDNEACVAELADSTVVLNSRNYLGTSRSNPHHSLISGEDSREIDRASY